MREAGTQGALLVCSRFPGSGVGASAPARVPQRRAEQTKPPLFSAHRPGPERGRHDAAGGGPAGAVSAFPL